MIVKQKPLVSETTNDEYVGKRVGVKIIGNSINPIIPLQQLSTKNKSYGVVGVGV